MLCVGHRITFIFGLNTYKESFAQEIRLIKNAIFHPILLAQQKILKTRGGVLQKIVNVTRHKQ